MPALTGTRCNMPQVDKETMGPTQNRPKTVWGYVGGTEQDEKRRACDFYSWFFEHPLPRKFLRHYIYENGRRLTLTEEEMVQCNPAIYLLKERFKDTYVTTYRGERSMAVKQAIGNEKQLMDMLFGGADQPSPLRPSVEEREVAMQPYKCAGGAGTNGTLGNFTVELRSLKVKVKRTGNFLLDGWRIEGEMRFFDEWDFDPKPFGGSSASNRPMLAEAKVRFADATLPGRKFEIVSPWVKFWRNHTDPRVQWEANGKLAPEPENVSDRLSKLAPIAIAADFIVAPGQTLLALSGFMLLN